MNVFSSYYSQLNIGYESTKTAGTVSQIFYNWKVFMTTAGWTVIASGDGLSNYSLSGDIFTSSFSKANGLGNKKSWFIIQEPSPGYAGSQRQFLVYRDSIANDTKQIMYSQQGFNLSVNGHNSSPISATNPPIAYDEILIGSQSSVSAYYPSQTFTSDITANSTASNSAYWNQPNTGIMPPLSAHFMASTTAPFSFYILILNYYFFNSTYTRVTRFFAFDELQEYTPGHPDPSVIMSCANTSLAQVINTLVLSGNSIYYSSSSNTSYLFGWQNKSTFTSTTDAINKTTVNYSNIYSPLSIIAPNCVYGYTPSAGNISYTTMKDISFPGLYVWNYYTPSYFGRSSFIYIKQPAKMLLQTYSINSAHDYIEIGSSPTRSGSLLIPWNGNTIL